MPDPYSLSRLRAAYALAAPSVATALCAFGIFACNSSDDEKIRAAELGVGCALNSDCGKPLVCVFTYCHSQCTEDRDCPSSERCVHGLDSGVCQLPQETACVPQTSSCAGSQICGVDNECRDPCVTKDQCTSGQVCVNGGQCASVLASKDALDDAGQLIPAPDAGNVVRDAGGPPDAATQAGIDAGMDAGDGARDAGATDAAGPPPAAGDEACGQPEAPANDDPGHASPYALNTDHHGCIQTQMDLDYFEFTTPADPVQGGVVLVKVTDVAPNGVIQFSLLSSAENGSLQTSAGTPPGVGGSLWVTTQAATTFRIVVRQNSGNISDLGPYTYTLRADYTGVPDLNEPNDQRNQATPLSVGTPMHGYMFAGWSSADTHDFGIWDDWYKVTLSAGTANIALSDFPSELSPNVVLFAAQGNGAAQTSQSGPAGSNLTLTPTVAAGDYYIFVSLPDPRQTAGTYSTGSSIPHYATQPYTLTVTGP